MAVSTFFFILLGTPSWIDINSIYLQLPIFMEGLIGIVKEEEEKNKLIFFFLFFFFFF